VSYRAAARDRGSPDVEITLTATNTDGVITHVTDGAADLGFIESPSAPRSLRSRVIGHDRLVVVVPPGHPWARRRRPVSAAELAGAAPTVINELSVADDLSAGRLTRIEIPELDLKRALRTIWNGSANPPGLAARLRTSPARARSVLPDSRQGIAAAWRRRDSLQERESWPLHSGLSGRMLPGRFQHALPGVDGVSLPVFH